MKDQGKGISMLRKRLARALRSGLITRREAAALWRRGNGARPSTAAPTARLTPSAVTASDSPIPAATAVVSAIPDGLAAGSAPGPAPEQACRPVLCRNADGELVWRRRGRCAQTVAENLGEARHQVVEVSNAGDLLPPLTGEEPLW